MSTPSKDDEYRVILDLLCCVMAADGDAAATEEKLIEQLLHDDGCSWSKAKTADVMNRCINRIKRDGVQATVKSASLDAKSLDAYRLEQLLWQCTDLAKADSTFSDREREVIQSIQLQIPQLRLMINAEDLRNSKNSS